MAIKRFTRKSNNMNPLQKAVYHIPMHWVTKFRMETFGTNTYMYGDMVDKLGKYEELGEPEEIAQKLGVRYEKFNW